MNFFEALLQGIMYTSHIEWLAVFFNMLYVVLAGLNKRICWVFGFFGAALYVYLCYTGNLYLESLLQVFYVGMAIYGWKVWGNTKKNGAKIRTLGLKKNLLWIALGLILTLSLAWIFKTQTNQAKPFMDAFTTIFSLIATFLVSRKIVENWVYWIAIDVVCVFLYHDRGFVLSAVLYTLYTVMAIWAWYKWKTIMTHSA